jgi:hypothetical protein
VHACPPVHARAGQPSFLWARKVRNSLPRNTPASSGPDTGRKYYLLPAKVKRNPQFFLLGWPRNIVSPGKGTPGAQGLVGEGRGGARWRAPAPADGIAQEAQEGMNSRPDNWDCHGGPCDRFTYWYVMIRMQDKPDNFDLRVKGVGRASLPDNPLCTHR